jgi:hypothetical protein
MYAVHAIRSTPVGSKVGKTEPIRYKGLTEDQAKDLFRRLSRAVNCLTVLMLAPDGSVLWSM